MYSLREENTYILSFNDDVKTIFLRLIYDYKL